MPSVHEILTEQFRQWESRGRGWRVFDQPVSPEPPFSPFTGHYLPETPVVDDGRKPTALSSFVQRLSGKLRNEPPAPPAVPEIEEEPEPRPLVRGNLIELQTSLPAKLDVGNGVFAQFLSNLALCREPIAFELVGTDGRVTVQFATAQSDAPLVRRQLQAHFTDAVFLPRESTLEETWETIEADEMYAVEFGLAREFMYPLANGTLDPFVGIIGALSELSANELGIFQVLFQPVQDEWADSILRSVTDTEGKPFFVNEPELTGAAENKIQSALYAAVVRIAVKGETFERVIEIARDMAGSLRVFAHPQGNELIPLSNAEYPFYDHIEDVLCRQSRRSGMILNSDELTGFVHLPSSAVRSPALERDTGKTKAAPASVRNSTGILLGNNIHAGVSVPVRLTPDQRVKHCHIIGASGTGKSTLIFNLIRQDIENGEGVAVLDPHGDLIDRILGIIPPERIHDVILVDPTDEDYSVGFNILSAHSDWEKNLLASDLVSVFERLSTSWGDQMASVLGNAIRAFLESDTGGTLADLQRFLIEPSYRSEFLKTVRDPAIVFYWQKSFPQLTGNRSIGPVLTRLDTFLGPKPIRYMVSQKENRIDFANIMNSQKILLAKLSKGMLGNANSYLLGTLFVSKLQQTAMSRQQMAASERRDFWLYIDEFHNFITPSMAEILTGARKYRLGLVLAHQELRQLERNREVASAALSSPYTRVVFRVGDADARALEGGFSSFEARDLQNLGTGDAVVRIEASNGDFNLSVPTPEDGEAHVAAQRRDAVVAASRSRYAIARADIESKLTPQWSAEQPVRKSKPDPTVAVADSPPASPTTPPVIQPPTVSVAKPAASSVDLGRGGEQHKIIQGRLKQAAEAAGFRATIEKSVLDNQGSIDLLLERPDAIFACEISISTPVDHEIRNINKCLKAGFQNVVVVCIEEERLRKIGAAASGSLGSEVAQHIAYFQPDQFIAHIRSLTPPVASPVEPQVRGGRRVKRVHAPLSAEEQKLREDAALKLIATDMRRKPKRRAD